MLVCASDGNSSWGHVPMPEEPLSNSGTLIESDALDEAVRREIADVPDDGEEVDRAELERQIRAELLGAR